MPLRKEQSDKPHLSRDRAILRLQFSLPKHSQGRAAAETKSPSKFSEASGTRCATERLQQSIGKRLPFWVLRARWHGNVEGSEAKFALFCLGRSLLRRGRTQWFAHCGLFRSATLSRPHSPDQTCTLALCASISSGAVTYHAEATSAVPSSSRGSHIQPRVSRGPSLWKV